MTTPAFPAGTILGYPRIGRRRELKRALEQHWAGEIDEAELDRVTGGGIVPGAGRTGAPPGSGRARPRCRC